MQALEGIRVVEFTAGMAGPWIGRFMAYCGAEVIRIEAKKHPDVLRLYVPPRAPELGTQPQLSPWCTDMPSHQYSEGSSFRSWPRMQTWVSSPVPGDGSTRRRAWWMSPRSGGRRLSSPRLGMRSGCALTTDTELCFRNLDGKGTLHVDLLPDALNQFRTGFYYMWPAAAVTD